MLRSIVIIMPGSRLIVTEVNRYMHPEKFHSLKLCLFLSSTLSKKYYEILIVTKIFQGSIFFACTWTLRL